MYGIFRTAFHFTKDKIVSKTVNGEKLLMRTVEDEIRIIPSVHKQQAADWIKETELYQRAQQDDTIEETINVPKPQKKVIVGGATPSVKPAGWGVKPSDAQTGFTGQPQAGADGSAQGLASK